MVQDLSQEARSTARAKVAEMIWAYTKSQLVGMAAKLNLAGILSQGARFPAEIAARTGVDPTGLSRLLRGFEMCGLVRQREDGRVEITELGEWINPNVPGSLHTIAVRTHDLYFPAWSSALRALERSQAAFEIAFGNSYFDYLSANREHVRTFNALMSTMCAHGARAVASAYDFSTAEHVVDVGGGEGILLCEILKANPHLKGTLFDSSAVLENARPIMESAGIPNQYSAVAGDFRVSVPISGDLYILKHVLHNWPDDCCVRILKNCHAAMGGQGRLIVIERVIREKWAPPDVRSDLHMFVLMNGAERTEAEFKALFCESGFCLRRSISIPSREHILEAVPC